MAASALVLWALLVPQVASSSGEPVAPVPPPRTIHYYAGLFGANLKTALAIAKCESQFKPYARNPASTAKGVYQFLDGTWAHYARKHWGADWVNHDVLNYGDNVELGAWVLANYGSNDWLSSKYCWGINELAVKNG